MYTLGYRLWNTWACIVITETGATVTCLLGWEYERCCCEWEICERTLFCQKVGLKAVHRIEIAHAEFWVAALSRDILSAYLRLLKLWFLLEADIPSLRAWEPKIYCHTLDSDRARYESIPGYQSCRKEGRVFQFRVDCSNTSRPVFVSDQPLNGLPNRSIESVFLLHREYEIANTLYTQIVAHFNCHICTLRTAIARCFKSTGQVGYHCSVVL